MSTPTGIAALTLVCVTTPEQDRAVAFYESIGFEKRTDTPFGGSYRWIEMYLPDSATGIALAPPPPDSADQAPINTGITLTSDDIDATHTAFRDLGVDVDPEVARMGDPIPPMFWFRDTSGHTLMVVENPA